MEIGSIHQKANIYLVSFVFACIVVIIWLLYVTQKNAMEMYVLESANYSDSI